MGIRIKRVIALVLSISLLDMQLVYGGNKSKVTGYDTDSFDKLTDISFNLYHSDAGEEFKIYGIDIDTLIDFLSYNYSLGGFLDNWEYIEDENYVQVRIKNKTDAIVRQRRTNEGKLINSDVNAAFQITKKVYKTDYKSSYKIRINPTRINVA